MSNQLNQIVNNPFKDWDNDDLLRSEKIRTYIETNFPNLKPVVEWQKLRDTFNHYEDIANRAKSDVKKRGRLIVSFGVIGLTLAAATSLVESNVALKTVLGAIAAASTAFSLVLGTLFRLRNPTRRAWLHSRYITERARHLYFHFLLSNASEVVHSMTNKSAREKLLEKRARVFDTFKSNHVFDSETPKRFQETLDDVAEANIWMTEAGSRPTGMKLFDGSQNKEDIHLYFAFMRIQRIGVQRTFSTKKTTASLFNPNTVHKIVSVGIDVLTVIIMVSAILVGLDQVLTANANSALIGSISGLLTSVASQLEKLPHTNTLIATGAIAAALLAGLRAFSQGTRLREETERYDWYEAAIREIEDDFDKAQTDAERCSALLHLESTAYRETRAFLASHRSARFLVD